MSRAKKRGAGRPSLGAAAQSRYVPLRLTPGAYDFVASRVEAGEAASVSEWIRAKAGLDDK